MIFVTIVDRGEFEHGNGITIVPFRRHESAMEYARTAAKMLDVQQFDEAVEDIGGDLEDIDTGDLLDRYNDIAIYAQSGSSIHVTSGFNSPFGNFGRAFDRPSRVEAGPIPYADRWDS